MEAIGPRQDASSRDVARQFGLEGTGDKAFIADGDISCKQGPEPHSRGRGILCTFPFNDQRKYERPQKCSRSTLQTTLRSLLLEKPAYQSRLATSFT